MPDTPQTVEEARNFALKAMAVGHPTNCAGVSARGKVQASGMQRMFVNATACDCPPENRAEARLDALIAAVEARTLARVRGRIGAALRASGFEVSHDELDTILRSLSASEDTTQGET